MSSNANSNDFAFLNATGKLRFNLMNDYLFRAVLQENAESLKHLISALLNLPYDDIIPASNEPSSRASADIWRMPRGSNTL